MRRWIFALGVVLMVGGGLSACSSTPANDFEAGECTDDDLSGSIGEISTVDCDEDHTAEAYAQFDLEDGDYPGAEEIGAQGTEECQGSLFEDYVGVAYEASIYTVNFLPPSEESWNDGDDRTVICVINGTTDGSALEGSAEGSEV